MIKDYTYTGNITVNHTMIGVTLPAGAKLKAASIVASRRQSGASLLVGNYTVYSADNPILCIHYPDYGS